MLVERKTCNVHVVRNDITLDLPGAVRDLKLLVRVDERRRGLRAEEGVVSTAAALLRLAVLGAHPEVGRPGVHEDVEVARRRADLHCRDVTDIIGSEKDERWNISDECRSDDSTLR